MEMRSNRRVFFRIALCAALVSGALVTGGASALADCQEQIYVDAYDVELEPRRDAYRVGDTALIDGTVTRKDTGGPVAGADFFVYMPPTRKGIVYGWAETDPSGNALLRMKLKRGVVDRGAAKIIGRAVEERADATCAQVIEYGELHLDRAFVVRK